MDQKLKQRLTGAIVLVALAVIFVPIILEGPDNEWTPRSHSIPEQPEMDYRASMGLEIPEQPAEAEATPEGAITEALALPERKPAPSAETIAKSEPVAPAPGKPAVKPPPPVVKAPPPAKKPAKQAEPALKGWFVQVGSFGEEMNASGLRDRLKAAGYDARLQKAAIGKGYAYRVLVGPAKTRAAAEKTAVSLKDKRQLDGMVIEYP